MNGHCAECRPKVMQSFCIHMSYFMFSNKKLQENVIQLFQMKGTKILFVTRLSARLLLFKKICFNNDKQLKIQWIWFINLQLNWLKLSRSIYSMNERVTVVTVGRKNRNPSSNLQTLEAHLELNSYATELSF